MDDGNCKHRISNSSGIGLEIYLVGLNELGNIKTCQGRSEMLLLPDRGLRVGYNIYQLNLKCLWCRLV